jgi:hypothetical protein
LTQNPLEFLKLGWRDDLEDYGIALANDHELVAFAEPKIIANLFVACSTPMRLRFWLLTPDFYIPKGYQGRSPCLVSTFGDPSARTLHNSRPLAYKFIIQIASNGNLQIKMHCFTSQHLPQR